MSPKIESTISKPPQGLFAVGDTLAQKGVEKRGLASHDTTRTARMALYGGSPSNPRCWIFQLSNSQFPAVFGLTITKWFHFLQHRINLRSPRQTLIARVAADQLVCAPTRIGVFLSSMSVLEGQDPTEKLQRAYWNALRGNWTVWPVLQSVNMYWVPLHYRVLTVNVSSIGC